MKKNLTFAFAMAGLLLCSSQKTFAQKWTIGGDNVAADSKLGTTSAFGLDLITNNQARFSIAETGRVAIGEKNFTRSFLTVNGTVGNTMAFFGLKYHGVSLINDPAAVAFNSYYRNSWKTIKDGYGGFINVNDSTGKMNFATLAYGLSNADVLSSVRMTMTNDGNLGIGTTSPVSRLHVVGNQTLAGNLNFTDGTQSIQFANPGTTPAPMMYMFTSGTVNTSRMVIAHSPSYPTWGLQYTDLNDQFDFLGSGVSKMTVNLSSGNIGIGTTTPVYRLDVCGTIRAKEVRVETGWCDYVFEKDYKLRSIDELENYINDNKHLPGIAPASEVEKEGLKVAEMNKAMMEKIEELSLYVIQLSKENKKLQSEIEALKN